MFTVHYLWWRMPPFMHQCWGLPHRLAQAMSPQGWEKLVNAVLFSLINEACVSVCCATLLLSQLVGPACVQARSSNPRGRACGPSGKGSRSEGILSGVVPVYLYCPAFNVSVSLGVYSRHACRQAAQPLSTPRTVGPGRAERHAWTGPTAAHQHAARHLLLSLTRQWLMTERWHLTQY